MSAYATLTQLKSDLGITDSSADTILQTLANAISDLIDEECGRKGRLYYRYVSEFLDVKERKTKYFPEETPVVLVSGHALKNASTGLYEADTRDAEAYGDYVEFITPFYGNNYDIFTVGPVSKMKALRLDIKVGFFEEGETPADLNMLTRTLVKDQYGKYLRSASEGSKDVQSKKIGGYSVTYAKDSDASADAEETLKTSGLYSCLRKYRRSLEYGTI